MPPWCKYWPPGRAAAALVLVAGAASLIPAQVRAAEARHLALNYEVYIGGFHTLSIAYDARLGPATYDLKVALDGKGILDWWFAWSMRAFSHGRLNRGAIVPVRAGADSSWNGKHRQTRLTYRPDGPPVVHLDPRPDDEDGGRDDVTPALRRGARDLAGAIFALLSRIGAADRCDGREAVFDGRRRYDLMLSHLGEDRREASNYSPYAGPALRCGLEIKRIAGYRRNPRRSRWSTDDTATVWLGKVFDGLPPVPVRLELDTIAGPLRAHLVQATLAAEGSVQRLARAP
jgi:hypothetical protein